MIHFWTPMFVCLFIVVLTPHASGILGSKKRILAKIWPPAKLDFLDNILTKNSSSHLL